MKIRTFSKIAGIFYFVLGLIFVSFLLRCKPVSWWYFFTGIVGLGLDLMAATLIVVTDISIFERFWKNAERYTEAEKLRDARTTFYKEGPLSDDNPEFDRLISVIRMNEEILFTPNQINPPSPGRLGGGLYVEIKDDSGDQESIPSDLFNIWVDNRIQRLKSGVRENIRSWGLFSLLLGFGLQVVSFILGNVTGFRSILNLLSC